MTSCRRNSTAWPVTKPASSAPSTCAKAYRCLKQFKIVQNERYEQEIKFHAMLAQQNSERTQPAAEPTTSEPLPADHFEKINREFEEIDRGLTDLGCFATPPPPPPSDGQ